MQACFQMRYFRDLDFLRMRNLLKQEPLGLLPGRYRDSSPFFRATTMGTTPHPYFGGRILLTGSKRSLGYLPYLRARSLGTTEMHDISLAL